MDYAHSKNVLPVEGELEMIIIEAPQEILLSAEQQLELMALIKVDDPDTKQQVIAQNLRLVVNIAKRYKNRGVEILDLAKEGIEGLIHALKNFEKEGGFQFSTYAARCVRRNIELAIHNKDKNASIASLKYLQFMGPSFSF